MSFRAIPRSEFDRLLPLNSFLENMMVEQVEWFSSKSGRLLGAVAKGGGYSDWNYVILKQDRKGDFHVRKVTGNFFSPRAARVDLLLSMATFGDSDSVNRVLTGSQRPSRPAELAGQNPDGRSGRESMLVKE